MRYNNLQLVRLLAATAVVVAHLGMYAEWRFHAPGLANLLRGTWLNLLVPTFFAISGFVLTQAIRKTPAPAFLLARALRLYPGFWLATILFALIIAMTGWPDSTPLGMRLANIGWSLRPGEYGSRLFILGIEWSLVYELVLYVCLAGLSLFGPRRLPIAVLVWLSVIVAKVAIWPGYGMNSRANPLPTWENVWVSAINTPFLLGSLAFYVRDWGRQRRWIVAAGTVAYLAIVPGSMTTPEEQWCAYSVAAAAIVWLSAQLPQLADESRFVRAGDYTYGLYLIHTPLLTGGFAILLAEGWLVGSNAGVALVGTIAVAVGLLFGKVEAAIHLMLRPLLKIELRSTFIAAACARIARGVDSLPARLLGRLAGSR